MQRPAEGPSVELEGLGGVALRVDDLGGISAKLIAQRGALDGMGGDEQARGLDALEAGQWRSIWPTIKEFKFLTDNVDAIISEDRLMCYAAVLWSSVGVRENGEHYDRPGRATVALKRADVNAPWRGYHTHFSEFPQERQKSFGGA